jgi:DUF4097 and DUF4098 domain-containing protein YvlB
MRNILWTVLAVAAAAAPAGAQAPSAAAQAAGERIRIVTRAMSSAPFVAMYQRGGDEQTDRQTRSFKIGAQGDIDASNIAGDITITRGSGNDATIEIVKRARGRSADDAREMLGLVQVEVTERSGRIEIRTQYPRGNEMRTTGRRNINVSVDLEITAPAGTRVVAHSLSGDLKATDIKGDLSLETVSGTVTISGASRITSAKSLSGDVSITDTQTDGSIEAGSVSGSISISRARARAMDLGSISGDIVVHDVECDRVDLHSFSGNVEYAGGFTKGGRYEMKSHSGDVRVAVGGSTGFEVEATTFSGSVRSDVQLQRTDTEPATNHTRRRSIRGTYGDGSAIVQITTFSGSVVVGKR